MCERAVRHPMVPGFRDTCLLYFVGFSSISFGHFELFFFLFRLLLIIRFPLEFDSSTAPRMPIPRQYYCTAVWYCS